MYNGVHLPAYSDINSAENKQVSDMFKVSDTYVPNNIIHFATVTYK